jgi:hypothetical protein
MLLLAGLLQVEIAAGDNCSYFHSFISLDLHHDLGMLNECLFNKLVHSFNK